MTRRTDLEELRDLLRESLREAPADKRGPLAAQFRATLAELESLTDSEAKAGDPVDDLNARRAARGAGAPPRARRAGS